MFKKAFTLAEVILVLGIIGIVATLTIPNLADDYTEEQTVIKVKQFKNDLDLALKSAILHHGEYRYWVDNFTAADKEDLIGNVVEFLEVLDDNANFPVASINNNSSYYKYELKNGILMAAYFGSNGTCSGDTCNIMQFYIATSGLGGATIGRDVFAFAVNPFVEEIHPYGYNQDKSSSNNFVYSQNDYLVTNWVVNMGNLDYLKTFNNGNKCPGNNKVLDWVTNTSCD